jgi:hypothetical protein
LKFFRKTEKAIAIEKEINATLQQMQTVGVGSDEYAKLLDKLERLNEVSAKNGRGKVDANTLAIICANLFGILIIVAYEQKHVLSSKALNQIPKLK